MHSLSFTVQLAVTAIVFMIPLKKRSHPVLRICTGASAGLLLSAVLSHIAASLSTFSSGNTAAVYIVYLGMPLVYCAAFFYFCCAVNRKDAVYGTLCAYAAQHFSHSLASVVRYLINHPATAENLYNDSCGVADLAVFAACLVSFYFIFAVRLPEDGAYKVRFRQTVLTAAVVIGTAFVISLWTKVIFTGKPSLLYIPSVLYDMLCCFFIMWIHIHERSEMELRHAIAMEQKITQMNKEQYEHSKDMIDAINMKYHDLKHQLSAIRAEISAVQDGTPESGSTETAMTGGEKSSGVKTAFRQLERIEQNIQDYDCMIKTGNRILDTVLTEKSLVCTKDHITSTFFASGRLLDFMDDVDMYVLFGNILDNAIESCRRIKDTEKRVITLTLSENHGAVLLTVENYAAEIPPFKDGLPVTTKEQDGSHGWGMKSIQTIVKKYGGVMNIQAEKETFTLSVLFAPVTKKRTPSEEEGALK